jgi:hypothetical protein
MSNLTVEKTILEQLGGRRFIMMTGAKNFVGGNNTLTFKLPGSSVKGKGNVFKITLEADDTYTLTLIKIFKMEAKTLNTKTGIYNDMLQEIFTDMTGLYTRL